MKFVQRSEQTHLNNDEWLRISHIFFNKRVKMYKVDIAVVLVIEVKN